MVWLPWFSWLHSFRFRLRSWLCWWRFRSCSVSDDSGFSDSVCGSETCEAYGCGTCEAYDSGTCELCGCVGCEVCWCIDWEVCGSGDLNGLAEVVLV